MHGFVATVRIKAMLATVRAQIFFQTRTASKRMQEALEDSRRGHKLMIELYDCMFARGKDIWATIDTLRSLPKFCQDIARRVIVWKLEHNSRFDAINRMLRREVRLLKQQQTSLSSNLIIKIGDDGRVETFKAP
ncbi:hypothetical protein [Candidatus Viridilinea mediisalina]|uniref:Uncharacterized protein n=1 Tax=Candidatus Viridilinea mediisalina TaxID=2024553 RepID=A0A2A6RF31_9CHLR|nr:hypothetical protein [Candidatus Viridilinea mediisalina]PDW01489.1 hypothetical protein CJ255_18835 [Candidatus Viridilinea mediisalina]